MWLQFFETTRFWKLSPFSGFRKIKNPIGQMQWLRACCKIHSRMVQYRRQCDFYPQYFVDRRIPTSIHNILCCFPTRSYTSTIEINITSYTWGLKKVPLLGGAKLHKQSQFTSKFIPTSIRDILHRFPTLSHTSAIEIDTISYTRGLRKVPLSGRAIQAIMRSTPHHVCFDIMNSPVMQCQFIMALK